MKISYPVIITALSIIFVACSDSDSSNSGDSPACTEAAFVKSCNAAKTAVTQCINGIPQDVPCGSGQVCNPATNLCESAAAPAPAQNQNKCDAGYQRACNSAFTGYTICENGQIIEKICTGGQTCNPASNLCETANPSQQPDCTESTYPRQCNQELTAYSVCEGGHIITKTCPEGQKCNAETALCESPSQPPQTSCTPESYTRRCNDDFSGYTVCEGGQIVTKTCPTGQACNQATAMCESPVTPPPEAECQEASHERKCTEDKTGYSACRQGKVTTVTCPSSQTCDPTTVTCKSAANPEPETCNEADYPPSCPNPHQYRYCKGGKVITETCKNGAMCNAAIKNKSCKVPGVGDKCDPSAFAETCFGTTEALICEEDSSGSYKVIKFDCTSDKNGLSKDFKCDIAPDFFGPGLDVTMCYSKGDICKNEGQEETVCEYDDEEDVHYTNTYLCQKFNTGSYYYLLDSEDCEKGGKKYACNKAKTECDYSKN